MVRWCVVGAMLLGLALAGCGGGTASTGTPEKKTTTRKKKKPAATETASASPDEDVKPLSLDAGPSASNGDAAPGQTGVAPKQESIVEALHPFNTLLGEWEGKTRKQFEGFARVDNLTWVWDFKADKSQPSVSFSSDKSPYFVKGWITYVPDREVYRLTLESPEKERRVLEGTWAEGGEPRQESDGKKLQWSFKQKLTQVEPRDGDQYQVELALLENNRYHMTIGKKPSKGTQFVQMDVVGTQRKNTSFAVADSDNPGPKCIVSGGLGTISVSHQGKTYYVCCTGCKAAFEDDPERWLAKMAKMQEEKKE